MSYLYFDIDKELEESTRLKIDLKVRKLFNLNELGTYSVILHNDPINGFDHVIRIIRSVFSYSLSKSIKLMLKAHFSGRSILWSGSQKEATEKMIEMVSFGPDPNMLRKEEASPLSVTIEKNG